MSVGLGKRFYKEFKDLSLTLIKNPYFQVYYKDVRRLPLKTFPYSIHFRIEEEQNIVYIETVTSDNLFPFSTKLK